MFLTLFGVRLYELFDESSVRCLAMSALLLERKLSTVHLSYFGTDSHTRDILTSNRTENRTDKQQGIRGSNNRSSTNNNRLDDCGLRLSTTIPTTAARTCANLQRIERSRYVAAANTKH
jgi:hypothetical protein